MGGLTRVEVKLKWDAGRWDQPTRHLDIIAATYLADAPYGAPSHVVHTESRSPDGTIHMTRHSETGLGLGFAEVMVLELDRLAPAYGRVMVGVAIHQRDAVTTFADVTHTEVVVTERYQRLISERLRKRVWCDSCNSCRVHPRPRGQGRVREAFRGSDADPIAFPAQMGRSRQP